MSHLFYVDEIPVKRRTVEIRLLVDVEIPDGKPSSVAAARMLAQDHARGSLVGYEVSGEMGFTRVRRVMP